MRSGRILIRLERLGTLILTPMGRQAGCPPVAGQSGPSTSREAWGMLQLARRIDKLNRGTSRLSPRLPGEGELKAEGAPVVQGVCDLAEVGVRQLGARFGELGRVEQVDGLGAIEAMIREPIPGHDPDTTVEELFKYYCDVGRTAFIVRCWNLNIDFGPARVLADMIESHLKNAGVSWKHD